MGATCRVEPPAPSGKVLVVRIAGEDLGTQFDDAAAATAAACEALEQLEDAPSELALLRMSTNACRVTHLLEERSAVLACDRTQHLRAARVVRHVR